MSCVLYKNGQFNQKFILGAVTALGAHVQMLAVEEHQTRSQGNITCAGNLMRAVTRLPCNLHKRSPLYEGELDLSLKKFSSGRDTPSFHGA